MDNQSRYFQIFLGLSLGLLSYSYVSAECCYGAASTETCAQCHCAGGTDVCNADTGTCPVGCARAPGGLSSFDEYAWSGTDCQIGNIAFRKPTSQRIDRSHFGSEKAVNGALGTENQVDQQNCAKPYNDNTTSGSAWWEVDLLYDYIVTAIFIHNSVRQITATYLNNFEVMVYNSNGTEACRSDRIDPDWEDPVPAGAVWNMTCDDVVGRSVRFQMLQGGKEPHLVDLCEVVVIGRRNLPMCAETTTPEESTSLSTPEESTYTTQEKTTFVTEILTTTSEGSSIWTDISTAVTTDTITTTNVESTAVTDMSSVETTAEIFTTIFESTILTDLSTALTADSTTAEMNLSSTMSEISSTQDDMSSAPMFDTSTYDPIENTTYVLTSTEMAESPSSSTEYVTTEMPPDTTNETLSEPTASPMINESSTQDGNETTDVSTEMPPEITNETLNETTSSPMINESSTQDGNEATDISTEMPSEATSSPEDITTSSESVDITSIPYSTTDDMFTTSPPSVDTTIKETTLEPIPESSTPGDFTTSSISSSPTTTEQATSEPKTTNGAPTTPLIILTTEDSVSTTPSTPAEPTSTLGDIPSTIASKSTVASVSTTAGSDTTTTGGQRVSTESTDSSDSLPIWAYIVIAFGSALLLAMVVMLILACRTRRRYKSKKKQDLRSVNSMHYNGYPQVANYPTAYIPSYAPPQTVFQAQPDNPSLYQFGYYP